jgi:hypothetical protein
LAVLKSSALLSFGISPKDSYRDFQYHHRHHDQHARIFHC